MRSLNISSDWLFRFFNKKQRAKTTSAAVNTKNFGATQALQPPTDGFNAMWRDNHFKGLYINEPHKVPKNFYEKNPDLIPPQEFIRYLEKRK